MNELGLLRRSKSRYVESEPLLRRAPATLARFTRAMGHKRLNVEAAKASVIQALGELNWTEAVQEVPLKSIAEDGS
jgi:hypothetical protein